MIIKLLRSMGLWIAFCAAAALLLSLALREIRAQQPVASPTVLVFGLALPQAIAVPAKANEIAGLTVAPPSDARFVCARFQAQRQAYTILDNAPIGLTQRWRVMFPFGFGTSISSHVRPQAEPALAPGSRGKALPTLVYTQNVLGLGTGALLIWLEGAHALFADTKLTFSLLLPMLLVFTGACVLTRLLLDGEANSLRLMLITTSIFVLYLGIVLFVLPVPSLDEAGDRYLNVRSALVLDFCAGCACAVGCGLWRGWHRKIMPRVGAFATICIATHLALNLLVVALLVPAGKLGFGGSEDVTAYAMAALEAEHKRLFVGPLPEWLTSLPTWQETCPPWSRHVVAAP